MATAWALAQLYGIHLHDRALTVYHLDVTTRERGMAPRADPNLAKDPIEQMNARLLTEVANITFPPCTKGRFFDQMTGKMAQVSQWKGN